MLTEEHSDIGSALDLSGPGTSTFQEFYQQAAEVLSVITLVNDFIERLGPNPTGRERAALGQIRESASSLID